jgi:hypothetical protein
MSIELVIVWGAQAASLQFAAACREHFMASEPMRTADFFEASPVHPASCRVVQAGSLRSPEFPCFELTK